MHNKFIVWFEVDLSGFYKFCLNGDDDGGDEKKQRIYIVRMRAHLLVQRL